MHIDSPESTIRFSHSGLEEFSARVFEQTGFSPQAAARSAQMLVRADLRAVDSHGVARLSGYVRLLEAGRINPRPSFSWKSRFPALWHLDADRAIGFESANAAMAKAVEVASGLGMAAVAVSDSNHFGIAGQYALMAAQAGMVGIAMTNASPLVAPTHSTERLLGTNPVAVAFPAPPGCKPFVLDMATTTAANGKLEILQRKKESAPHGWIQDDAGNPVSDPHALKKGGALLPLGGTPDAGSHKGYGLGAVVDLLSGVLSGANFGPWVPPFVSFLPLLDPLVGKGLGHFFLCFRVDGFMSTEDFARRMEIWGNRFRGAAALPGRQVQVPGDPEWEAEAERSSHGIPLLLPVIEDLKTLSSRVNIPVPVPC